MRRKIIIVFVAIFSLQLIASCCKEEVYEYTVTGVSSRTLTLNGINFIEITDQDVIDKEDLQLEVVFQGTEVLISELINKISKVGFQSAYASIDCPDPIINYKNQVVQVEIVAIDINNNNAEVNVTNDLVISGGQTTIAEYLSINSPNVRDGFVVEFNDVSNLPSQAEFKIKAYLDNNTIVETVTNQVNFN